MPGALPGANNTDPQERPAGVQPSSRHWGRRPGASPGAWGRLSPKVTPEVIPESALAWVGTGGGQDVQVKLLTPGKAYTQAPNAMPTTSSSFFHLIPETPLRDEQQGHFMNKDTGLEKSSTFPRPTPCGQSQDGHEGQVHLPRMKRSSENRRGSGM